MRTNKRVISKDSRIAVYSRKSREEDGEDSLENHRIRLTDFIKDNQLKNVDWYEEVVSGGTINSRPKFVELLDKVKNLMYKAVIVIDLDRLSRGDTFERGVIERAFKESKTLIMTVKGEVLDYTDTNEALTANVKGLLANFELEQIKTRLKEGKKSTVKKGIPHSGVVPYGYDWDRNLRQVTVNEEEKKVYHLMIKWYLMDRMSMNSIAKKLNDLGYKTSRGGIWHGNRVSSNLKNDFHLGYVTHGKWKSAPTDRLNKDGGALWITFINPNPSEATVIKGNHEPIKTEEEHAKILNRALEGKVLYANKTIDNGGLSFKLKSLVRCPFCGLTVPIVLNGANGIHYVKKCGKPSKKRKPECSTNKGVNESILYEMLLAKLNNFREKLFNPLEDGEDNSVSAIENEIIMYQGSLVKIKKKISKHKEMFEADIIDINELKSKVSESEKDIERIEYEISKLNKSADYVKKKDSESKRKIWSSDNVTRLLDSSNVLSNQEINSILKRIVLYITYHRDNDEIALSIVYR